MHLTVYIKVNVDTFFKTLNNVKSYTCYMHQIHILIFHLKRRCVSHVPSGVSDSSQCSLSSSKKHLALRQASISLTEGKRLCSSFSTSPRNGQVQRIATIDFSFPPKSTHASAESSIAFPS